MIKKLRELYAYRELLFNLVKKELKIRYKNSVLGFFWSLLNPLLMMLIFTFVFAHIFKLGIKNFPIFLLTGLLPWNFFNMALSSATGSVVSNGHLVKKVYFPREVLPISIVFADLINFLIAMVMLFAFLIVYGYNFYLYIPILLVVIVIQTILTVGLSLLLAGINVYFRDIQYIVNVALLALFYATPIIYNIQMVENMNLTKRFPFLLTLYEVNPLSSLMIMYRNVLYETHLPSIKLLGYSALTSVAVLLVGYFVFHRLEPAFAEEV